MEFDQILSSLSVCPLYLTGVVPKELAKLRNMHLLVLSVNVLESECRVIGC